MREFLIRASDENPEIKADPLSGKIDISGKSLKEDVSTFYAPFLEWLEEYARDPKDTVVNFRFSYFNTSSSKIILDILLLLEKIKDSGCSVRIIWNYSRNDEEMYDAGMEYSEMVNMPFKFISYIEKDIKR